VQHVRERKKERKKKEGTGRGGMRRKQLPEDLKETTRCYVEIFLGAVETLFFF
jgi:hypothetical protein